MLFRRRPRPDTTPTDWTTRLILAVVMLAALAVGTWSIYTLLTERLHVPAPVAFLGCGLFDIAAVFFGRLSQKYATTTDSGFAPKAAMFLMVATSAWVNWQHAAMEGWGTVGSVILASAPVIAELSFTMLHTYEHRATLRRLGRVPEALQPLGKWAWLTHPVRARLVVWAQVRALLVEHEAVAARREELAVDRARAVVVTPETTVERVSVPASRKVSAARETARRPRVETKVPAETKQLETGRETSETKQIETSETAVSPVRETKPRKPAETETTKVVAIGDPETETALLVSLMKSRGGADLVSIHDAITETKRPKSTAAKRLKAAKERYTAETDTTAETG